MNAQEKRLATAMTKTLHAYEDLIADPEGEKGKWKRYGASRTCILCRELKVFSLVVGDKKCKPCPIFLCTDISLRKMAAAIRGGDSSIIEYAAKARYKWLIKKLESNGWEYK